VDAAEIISKADVDIPGIILEVIKVRILYILCEANLQATFNILETDGAFGEDGSFTCHNLRDKTEHISLRMKFMRQDWMF